MSETALSRRLGQRLSGHDFMYHPVENKVALGTPDIWYGVGGKVGGWIELKQVHMYPKRIPTPIRFKRYTIEQVGTIENMGKSCGRSWVLIQIEADHYLFHWQHARDLWHTQPRPWWEANCRGYWKNRLNYEQLRNILHRG